MGVTGHRGDREMLVKAAKDVMSAGCDLTDPRRQTRGPFQLIRLIAMLTSIDALTPVPDPA